MTTDGNAKYQNLGQVGAMGDNAHVELVTQNQGAPASMQSLNYPLLLEQLTALRQAIDKVDDVTSDEKDQAIAGIHEAKEAARKEDPSGIQSGLRKAGKWVGDVAEKTGIYLVANLTKDAIIHHIH